MSSAGQLWRRWMWRNILGGIIGFVAMIVLASAVGIAGYFSGLISFDPERIAEIRFGTVTLGMLFVSLPLIFFVTKSQIPVFKERLGYFSGTRWITTNMVVYVLYGFVSLVGLMIMFPGGASTPLSATENLNVELPFPYNHLEDVMFSFIFSAAIWYFSLGRYAVGFWSWVGWNLTGTVFVIVTEKVSTAYLLPLSPLFAPIIMAFLYIFVALSFMGIGVVNLRSRGLPDDARADVAKTFA